MNHETGLGSLARNDVPENAASRPPGRAHNLRNVTGDARCINVRKFDDETKDRYLWWNLKGNTTSDIIINLCTIFVEARCCVPGEERV